MQTTLLIHGLPINWLDIDCSRSHLRRSTVLGESFDIERSVQNVRCVLQAHASYPNKEVVDVKGCSKCLYDLHTRLLEDLSNLI